jgi:23S rRNA pseudouridine1911/1915/1917 synthase
VGNVEEEKELSKETCPSPKRPHANGCFADPEIGKPAITHYQVLERFGYVTLISCQLETGRTHQIRAHKHMGHPLFNDERYGGHLI